MGTSTHGSPRWRGDVRLRGWCASMNDIDLARTDALYTEQGRCRSSTHTNHVGGHLHAIWEIHAWRFPFGDSLRCVFLVHGLCSVAGPRVRTIEDQQGGLV